MKRLCSTKNIHIARLTFNLQRCMRECPLKWPNYLITKWPTITDVSNAYSTVLKMHKKKKQQPLKCYARNSSLGRHHCPTERIRSHIMNIIIIIIILFQNRSWKFVTVITTSGAHSRVYTRWRMVYNVGVHYNNILFLNLVLFVTMWLFSDGSNLIYWCRASSKYCEPEPNRSEIIMMVIIQTNLNRIESNY